MDRMKQCQAKSKQSGERCRRYTTKGMKVYRMHGGVLGDKTSQKARRKAALRHGLYTQKVVQENRQILQIIKLCKQFLSTLS